MSDDVTPDSGEQPDGGASTTEAAAEDTQSTGKDSAEQSAETKSASQKNSEGQGESAEQPKGKDAFFDPEKVPEELKPAYKQMQAEFTKKNQEFAAAKKKADAWDQQQVEAQAKAAIQQQSPTPRQKEETDDLFEKAAQKYLPNLPDADKATVKAIANMIGDINRQQMQEQLQKTVQPMQMANERTRISNEWKDLESRFPDAADVKKEIGEAIIRTGNKISMEDAYKIVRHDALIEAAKEQGAQEAAKTQAEKKKVASVGGQNQKTSAPKEKRNLDQILDENFDKYFEQ